MARTTVFKQIPAVPSFDNPALTEFLKSIKQILENYQGITGNPDLDRVVRYKDLTPSGTVMISNYSTIVENHSTNISNYENNSITNNTNISNITVIATPKEINVVANGPAARNNHKHSNIKVIAGKNMSGGGELGKDVILNCEVDDPTITYINIEDYGASTAGTPIANYTAITSAIAAMSAGDILLIPVGTFPFTSVVFDPPDGCGLLCQGILSTTSGGFTVGNSTALRRRYHIQNLNVITPTPDHSSGRIGIKIINMYESYIDIRHVEGFETGVYVIGDSTGCVYNEIHLGALISNKITLHLTAANSGWCNENNFYGGRFTWDSSLSPYTGFKHIIIDYYSTHILNNNRFYSPSLEGGANYGVFAIDCDGYNNTFYTPRFEMGTAKIINFGSNSKYNQLLWGYGLATFTDVTDTGTRNVVFARNCSVWKGGDASGVVIVKNESSNSYPSLVIHSSADTAAIKLHGSGEITATTLNISDSPASNSHVGNRGYNDSRYAVLSNNLSDVTAATALGNLLSGTDISILSGAKISATAGTDDHLFLNSKGTGLVAVNYNGGSGGLQVYDGSTSGKLHILGSGIINFKGTMGAGSDDPTTNAPTDWVEIQINGTTRYIPVYT